jgi:UDP-2,4-diacetamido-2,4,6-trideoxy-beta-L-altropyranose hydrolase
MIVVIRTDASLQIGSGHLMRCLTLAEELRQRGAEVSFICRSHPGHLIGLLEAKGYAVARLAAASQEYQEQHGDLTHASWLAVSWQQDAADTIAALGETRPDWLIADSYALDRRWEGKLRPLVGKILVIDDLADRPHDCDLLLDQNLYHSMERRYNGLVPTHCDKLLGPKYALLRPEFLHARQALRKRDGVVKRVLIFFGGVDPTNETEKVLHALSGVSAQEFEVDVLVGGWSLRKNQVESFCAEHAAFHYHCQVDNMAQLMAGADLAIGAGGTATWERCALGLPALVVTVAQNQVELATCGAEKGLFFYLGAAETVTMQQIQDVFRVFHPATATLRAFAAASLSLVDARGAQRVAGMIAPPDIKVRTAEDQDCDAIYRWRNAEETRRFIFDASIIPLETHRIWFRNTLANPNRVILIGEISGHPVGVLRYDFSGEQALISVYLVPGWQGQGVGTGLIRSGSRWLREHRPETKVVNAEIMRANGASLVAFAQAGYQEHHVTYQEVFP